MASVEDCLGIEDLLVEADSRWPAWCEVDSRLAVCPSRAGLREWLAENPVEGRGPLLALAMLAAPDGGGDDPAAAAVVAWLMLPAAGGLARRYRPCVPAVEAWLAAQLWVEARSVPWRRTANPAAHIKFALAHRLRAEVTSLEVPHEPGEDLDLVVQEAQRRGDAAPEGLGSDELLALVLERAVAGGVITAADRQLLTHLVAYAHAHRPVACRGNGGLTSVAALTHVSRQRGVPVRTVSRRARAAITAISDAHHRHLVAM